MLRSPVDGQGSPAALSIAALDSNFVSANPATFAIAGIGIAAVTGATFLYHSIKAKKEAEFRSSANAVNVLHREYLQDIFISNGTQIPGFPQPFSIKRENDGKYGPVEMMHLTDDQIEHVGTNDPEVDVNLKKYRELIKDACRQLKAYYIEREGRDDITAGVVSYLLTILDSHCLKFAGYEFDIAYLNAIARFINGYASKDENRNTPEFTRLSPVYSTLLKAVDELKEHQNIISLKSISLDIDKHSKTGSEELIRALIQLITQDEKWKYIKNATFDDMSKGYLRRTFSDEKVLGLIPTWDKEVKIDDSYFFDWLKFLFRYYEEGLDDKSGMTLEEILPPSVHFKLPNLEKLNDKDRKKETRTALDSIRKLFELCDNFLTRKPHPLSDTEFTPVSTDAEVLERANVLQSMATLIHYLISLQYVSSYILKSLKQIGEIRFKNPKHYAQVFKVFEQICLQTIKATDDCKKQMDTIQSSINHRMRLADQNNLPFNIQTTLTNVRTNLSDILGKARGYCKKAAESDKSMEKEYESVEQAIFLVVAWLGKTYGVEIKNIRSSTDAIFKVNKHWEDAVKRTMSTPPVSPRREAAANSTGPSYWDRNKSLLKLIVAGTSITCMLAAFIISVASAGALSPLAAFLGMLGVEIGIAGAGLYALDALFGFVSGLVLGGAVDDVMLANNAIRSDKKDQTSAALIKYRLDEKAEPDKTVVKEADKTPTPPPKTAEANKHHKRAGSHNHHQTKRRHKRTHSAPEHFNADTAGSLGVANDAREITMRL